jgi:hypothetical protein
MGARLQLSLPFPVPPSSAPPLISVAPTTTAAAPSSQTRRLVESIAAANPGARVRIIDTRSRLLHWSERDGVRTFHVHKLFLDTDEEERTALARYLATGCPRAGAVVDAVVQRQRFLLDFTAEPLRPDAHVGRTHDLAVIRDQVNLRYFAGAIVAEITWAPAPRSAARVRRSITYGTYDWRERRIAIHPALDEPDVPALVVSRVVHHEMLHARHGEAIDVRGRRVLHSPAFRAEEALFDGAGAADRWLDENLGRMLAWRPRR